MELLIVLGVFFLAPAAVIGGLVAAVARWRGKRAGKAFWLAFLITLGLEALGFGLCIAAFSAG